MKKESKYTQYLEWGIMIVLFIGVFWVSDRFDFVENLKPDTSFEKYVMLIGIFLMAFVVLAVHELGHLIVGLMNGFRFELYVVGPLGIKRDGEVIKVYLNKNLGYYGGVAGTSPKDSHPNNAKIFARILLAGPIASVLFAIVCFGIAYLIGKPYGMIGYTGGLVSVMIFFATTIPSKTGMFFTDRKRYQRLVTPGHAQNVELAMLNIVGRFSVNNSYKNIDRKDIDILVSDKDPSTKYFGLFNLLCFQLENFGAVEEEVTRQYEEHSKLVSKNLVAAFDKEIENFKEKLTSDTNIAASRQSIDSPNVRMD